MNVADLHQGASVSRLLSSLVDAADDWPSEAVLVVGAAPLLLAVSGVDEAPFLLDGVIRRLDRVEAALARDRLTGRLARCAFSFAARSSRQLCSRRSRSASCSAR